LPQARKRARRLKTTLWWTRKKVASLPVVRKTKEDIKQRPVGEGWPEKSREERKDLTQKKHSQFEEKSFKGISSRRQAISKGVLKGGGKV